MEYIYQLAADIGSECRDLWLANYPDLSTFEHLTPCGAFEISYDEEHHTPRVNITHPEANNQRPLPNITAAILRELPDIRDIEEEYYEERREYYRAGYPEETTTNADFYDMTNVR